MSNESSNMEHVQHVQQHKQAREDTIDIEAATAQLELNSLTS